MRMVDRWRTDKTLGKVVTPCVTCRHRPPEGGWTCKAFPNGIPQVILTGDHLHREPFEGDNGIQYEPRAD